MGNPFFDRPILNSPYDYPTCHWELDDTGQPTQKIIETRRNAQFVTPIPKPKKQKGVHKQSEILFDEGEGLSTEDQRYAHTAIINRVRQEFDRWRLDPDPNHWRVNPETARLLQHRRHHPFSSLRPFFCQIEAVETAIWLTEVAPHIGKAGKRFLNHLADANPELMRLKPSHHSAARAAESPRGRPARRSRRAAMRIARFRHDRRELDAVRQERGVARIHPVNITHAPGQTIVRPRTAEKNHFDRDVAGCPFDLPVQDLDGFDRPRRSLAVRVPIGGNGFAAEGLFKQIFCKTPGSGEARVLPRGTGERPMAKG